MFSRARNGLRPSFLVSLILLAITAAGTAQDGVSTAGAAKTRYLGNLGILLRGYWWLA